MSDMREILFKAKRIDNREWVKGCLLIDYITGQYFIHQYGNSVNESAKIGEEGFLRFLVFEVDPSTICRYTGLTDKNDKKIWENDIVKDDVVLGSVVWDEHYAQFMIDDVHDGHQEYTDCWNEVEVIGNIFDNPGLLGQEELR